ncbi:hypothetical protein D9M68_287010 [compost metagenome]
MISRKLIGLLLVSALLAWITGESDNPAPVGRHPSITPAAPSAPAQPVAAAVADEPWRRAILLPAVEPVEPPEPSTEPEQPPILAPVEPPPPPAPSAPPLPITYLGKLSADRNVVLYLRYQDQPVSLKVGELLGEDYRLEEVAPDHAVFRYLPLDIRQELRWHARQ